MKDGENVCCSFLRVVACSDTSEHAHLFCDAHYTIKEIVTDNEWVKNVCLCDFTECAFYPRGEE